jgi:hypothetical protein
MHVQEFDHLDTKMSSTCIVHGHKNHFIRTKAIRKVRGQA